MTQRQYVTETEQAKQENCAVSSQFGNHSSGENAARILHVELTTVRTLRYNKQRRIKQKL
eukprot:1587482-Amphidinium_carterae.1